MAMIQAIFGLGNPGTKYQKTRHNAGFWFVDAIAQQLNLTFKAEKKFKAEVTQFNHNGNKIHLIKPQTFVNESGQSVIPFANFYRIPTAQILIAYDELDLPAGAAKIKLSGGHSGHNGLRSIIPGLGADFARLRIGIGRPQHRQQVVSWVLGNPSADDTILLQNCLDNCLSALDLMLNQDWEKAMHQLHSSNL